MDALFAIGQRIMAGLPDTEIDPQFKALVRECKVGNVILFRRNIESRGQLERLCRSLRELILAETGAEPLIAIDQEGGVVTRLSGDMINTPGAMALAAAGGDAAYRAGLITASELRSVGVNFNLAPDLDVNSNPNNPVIGVRSFGDEPGRSSKAALEFMRGTLEGGVMACGKHFPGHGDTAVDSHLGLPRVEKSREELEAQVLQPFRRAIEAGIPAIMTSHVLFPALEPERIPCTMSRRILTGLLRQELGFGGVIISDCMEMQAIARYYGTVEGAAASIMAGADIVCISHTASLARETAARLASELGSGRLDAGELEASVQRILRAKAAIKAMPGRDVMPGDAAEARELLARSFALVRGPMPHLSASPVFIGCPPSRVNLASSRVRGQKTFAEAMSAALGGMAVVTPEDPEQDDIDGAAAAAASAGCIVLGCCNANLHPGQMELMRALGGLGKPMAVVALRNPYELLCLPENAAGIACWEYTDRALAELPAFLKGERPFTGVMPLTRSGF